MGNRGSYRSLYGSFFYDEDAQRLSDRAFRVVVTLKGTLPASGIDYVMDDALAELCNCGVVDLEEAYRELEQPKRPGALGWIVRERNVVWLVNALRFEPNLRPNDSKHRSHIGESLTRFGGPRSRLSIVQRFKQHYPEWFGGPARNPRPDRLSDIPSDTVSDSPPEGSLKGPTQGSALGSTQGSALGSTQGSASAQDKTETKQNKTAARARARARAADVVDIAERRQQPIETGFPTSYLSRCVVALNAGMQRHPHVNYPREIVTSAQAGITWEQDGIDVDLALKVIEEKCAAFAPTNRNPQITSLKYFDNAVRERWENLCTTGDVGRARQSGRSALEERWAREQHYTF